MEFYDVLITRRSIRAYKSDPVLRRKLSVACGNQGFLAARAEGLGTCWIGAFDNQAIKTLLGIPAGTDVVAVTPLGFPAQEEFQKPGPRKNLDDILSFDAF